MFLFYIRAFIFAGNGSGSYIESAAASIAGGSWTYYITLTRIGTSVSLRIYSDQAKTSLVSQTSLTLPSSYDNSFTYTHPMFWDIDSYAITGYVDDVRIRKYVIPEPTWST